MYLVLVGDRERSPGSLRLAEPQASVALDPKDKRDTEWPTVVTKPPLQATYHDSQQEVPQEGEGCFLSPLVEVLPEPGTMA